MVRPAAIVVLLMTAGLTAPAIADSHRLDAGADQVEEVCYPYGEDSQICLPGAAPVIDWQLPEDWDVSPGRTPSDSDHGFSRFLKSLSEFRFDSFASPEYSYEY